MQGFAGRSNKSQTLVQEREQNESFQMNLFITDEGPFSRLTTGQVTLVDTVSVVVPNQRPLRVRL